MPGKADEEKQAQLLKLYRDLKKRKKPEDTIYFVDGVHPQHNSLPSYGWLPRGEEVKLKSNMYGVLPQKELTQIQKRTGLSFDREFPDR